MATKPKKNEAKTDYLKRCTDEGVSDGKSRRDAYAACNAVWDGRKNALSVTVDVELSPGNGEDKPRGFLMTAKTGKPVNRGYYNLAIDMSGVRTEKKMPILRQHDPKSIVGHGQAYKDGDSLYVEGEFSKVTADADEVLKLSDEGYPWQASIGVYADQYKILYSEKEVETVNGYEVKGPAIIYQKSHVREVSFVSLGADPDSAAIAFSDRSEQDDGDDIFETAARQNQGERIEAMDLKELKETYPDLYAQVRKEGYDEGLAAGIDQERGRTTEILEAGADAEATMAAVKEGTPTGDAYKAFFQAEKAKKADGLKQLEEQATPAQGQDDESGKPEDESNLTAGQVLTKRAKKLAGEKGIDYDKAVKHVLSADPELKKAYKQSFAVE